MKKFLFLNFTLIYFLLINITLFAQQDPFNWTEPVTIKSSDIFMIFTEQVAGNHEIFQKLYKYKIDSVGLPTDSMISNIPRQQHSQPGAASNGHVDIATGRFNSDQYDDVVTAAFGQNGLEIMIPHFDTTGAMWNTTSQLTINVSEYNRCYVRTGDFDADSLDEFIVAFVDSDDSIHINLYDVDSDLNPTFVAEIVDEDLGAPFDYGNISYFITSGDLNNDGRDEIVLQFKPGTVAQTSWDIYTKIYEYNGSSIEAKARTVIQPKPGPTTIEVTIAITSGQFVSDAKEELAYVAMFKTANTSFAYILLLEASPDLQQINFDFNKRTVRTLNNPTSNSNQLSLASGDLNNDGWDEIVVATGNRVLVQSTDDNLDIYANVQVSIAEGGASDFLQSYNFLQIADVNQDNRNDIITTKNLVNSPYADGFFVAMLTANDALDTLSLLGRNLGDEPQYDHYQKFAITVGNFDGYDFTIGQPIHHVQTDIAQPLVVLNAPPVHFDKFGTEVFDVSGCYNGSNCDFISTYHRNTVNTAEVSTKIHKDWGVSGGVYSSGSINAAPAGVGASSNYEVYLLGKYGKQFSKDTTNISTVSVHVSYDAIVDDWIFTTITDYDIWEYPVYHGNESFPRRMFMAMVPKNTRGAWFASKSWNALKYIPDHQVSNVFSYQVYDSLRNNSQMQQPIRRDFIGDSHTVSATGGGGNWELQMSDFQSSSADTTKEIGVNFKLQIPGVQYQADYNKTQMSTHKVSVLNGVRLSTHLGNVNSFQNYGETEYTVTPYAYWGTSGAVVLNFAASPSTAPPGFPPTFWQQKYGNDSDPTFILPWILDPEKGFGISQEAKRYQTKDIVFDPVDPNPGDTLTITARVRNFSLVNTPGPVSVKFYIDDPDSGGTPIIGLNGTNIVNTSSLIASRERSDVEIQWVVPGNLPSYPRIYAVLDQENSISEVHENNNKGFNVLGNSSITNIDTEEHNNISKNYELHQSYPNPFNPVATIKFSMKSSEKVSLEVFNSLGQKVKTLINRNMPAGEHSVLWDARNDAGNILSSGVYFYQIKAGKFIHTRKMILIK